MKLKSLVKHDIFSANQQEWWFRTGVLGMLKLLLLARHYFSLSTEPVMDAQCIDSTDWLREIRTDIKTRKKLISTQHILKGVKR